LLYDRAVRHLHRLARQLVPVLLTVLLGACAGSDEPDRDASRSPKGDAARGSDRGERSSDRGATSQDFDRAVERLDIKQPPLRVQQTIQFGKSHRLYVAVRRRYFLCTLSVPERRRAVEEFFARSRHQLEDAGVNDFSMVVTRVQSAGMNYPRWAVAGPQRIRLTQAGRRSRC